MTTSSTSQVSTRIRTAAATAQANWSRISIACGVAVGGRGEQLRGRGAAEPAGPRGVERRARGVLLQAAELAALARQAVGDERQVPDLAGTAVRAAPQPALEQQPGGEAGAEREEGEVVHARPASPACPPSTVCAAPTTATVRSFSTRTCTPEPLGDERRRAGVLLLDAEVDGVLDQCRRRRRRRRAARCRRRRARRPARRRGRAQLLDHRDRDVDHARARPDRGQPHLVPHHAVAVEQRRRAPWCRRCRARPTTGVAPVRRPCGVGIPCVLTSALHRPGDEPGRHLVLHEQEEDDDGDRDERRAGHDDAPVGGAVGLDQPLQPQRQRALRRGRS